MTRRIILKALCTACTVAAFHTVPLASQQLDGPPSDLKLAASRLYTAYARAVATPTRSTIAAFYAPCGTVVRTINGTTRRSSRAALDSTYRGRWTPPAYFRFDSLSFDSLAPGQVLVSGGFLWQSPGSRDTLRGIYAALLEVADSGLVIRFEHETVLPPAK